MKTRSTRAPESAEERRSAASASARQATAAAMPDTRAASLAQLRHQARASNSSQAAQLRERAGAMAGRSIDAAVQGVEDEQLLQGKFETVQRTDEEEAPQGKFDALQRKEREAPLQGRTGPVSESPAPANAPVQRQAAANHTGLPDQLKAGIESLSGMRMDHVRVHHNSDRPAQLNAHAFAQGSEIHVAPGQERHLPHEAWHVVQQAQGRVKPTLQMKAGVPVNDDAALEAEADAMGETALRTGPLAMPGAVDQPHLDPHAVGAHAAQRATRSNAMLSYAHGSAASPVQRYIDIDASTSAQTGIPDGAKVSNRQGLVKIDSRTMFARKDLIEAGTSALAERSRIVLVPGDQQVFDFTHMPSDSMPSLFGPPTVRRSLHRVIPRQNPAMGDPRANYGIPSASSKDGPTDVASKHRRYIDAMKKLVTDFDDISGEIIDMAAGGKVEFIEKGGLPIPRIWNWIIAEPLRKDYFQGMLLCVVADYDKEVRKGNQQSALAVLMSELNLLKKKVFKVLDRDSGEEDSVLTVNDCKQHTQSVVGADKISAADPDAFHDPGLGGNYHSALSGPEHGAFGWNFHFAPIVMKDGPDNATFETAAGLSFADVDKATWWWGMYGTRMLGQTFKSQIKKAHAERNLGLIEETPIDQRDPGERENIEFYTFIRDSYEQDPESVNDSDAHQRRLWKAFHKEKGHLIQSLQAEGELISDLMARHSFATEEYRLESAEKLKEIAEWMAISYREDRTALEALDTRRELDKFARRAHISREANHDHLWERLRSRSTTMRLFLRFRGTGMLDTAFKADDKLVLETVLEVFELFRTPLWLKQ